MSIDCCTAGGQQQPRRSTARSSICGQCHVVSWRRKLNTDSYENEISFLFSVDCVRTCCVRTDTAADDLWKTLVALFTILLTVGLRSLFDADVYTPRRYSVTSYFLRIACNAWVDITVHALFTIWALKCCRIKMFCFRWRLAGRCLIVVRLLGYSYKYWTFLFCFSEINAPCGLGGGVE